MRKEDGAGVCDAYYDWARLSREAHGRHGKSSRTDPTNGRIIPCPRRPHIPPQVHVCDAKTLPEVLSQFWRLVAKCAQAKFSAMTDDRDYAAHVLFVVHQCDLLKDYGMMRQLVSNRRERVALLVQYAHQ